MCRWRFGPMGSCVVIIFVKIKSHKINYLLSGMLKCVSWRVYVCILLYSTVPHICTQITISWKRFPKINNRQFLAYYRPHTMCAIRTGFNIPFARVISPPQTDSIFCALRQNRAFDNPRCFCVYESLECDYFRGNSSKGPDWYRLLNMWLLILVLLSRIY